MRAAIILTVAVVVVAGILALLAWGNRMDRSDRERWNDDDDD